MFGVRHMLKESLGNQLFGLVKVRWNDKCVRRVRFDDRTADRRLVEVHMVRFDHRKACSKSLEVQSPFRAPQSV